MRGQFTMRAVGAALLVSGLALGGHAAAATVNVGELAAAPTLDGSDADWASVPGTTIPLNKTLPGGNSDVESVSIKGGVFGDDVYFVLRWRDATHDLQHKPYVWDEASGKYVGGPQREDRLAIQFLMDGDYSTDWFSGANYTADMWHWKSFRSNTLGLVHDKMTIITSEPTKRAYKVEAKNGQTIYIRRPSDEGDKLYVTKRYTTKEGEVMPKYVLNEKAKGSVADIQAKGVWQDGEWVLEIRRKLDTGHGDDIAFVRGGTFTGGIAVFNRSGNEDHNVSDTVTFQF